MKRYYLVIIPLVLLSSFTWAETNENKSYEGTYLINSDLDNYARLTGYLYLKDGGTKKPGLEALFIDHR